YDTLDLEHLPAHYLPRSNYRPACSPDEYARRMPRVSWVEEGETEAKPVTAYYRVISRRGLSISGERTLLASVATRDVCHIDGVFSVALRYEGLVHTLAGLWASVLFDFIIKSYRIGAFSDSMIITITFL